jgi:hypothetical protein
MTCRLAYGIAQKACAMDSILAACLSIGRLVQTRRAIRENGMNWTDVMKNNADLLSRDHASSSLPGTRSAAPTSWDPHEVWLTRVKEPRERAARRFADSALGDPAAASRSSPR